MGTAFKSLQDFVGTYYGNYDGRAAMLQIDVRGQNGGDDVLVFQFTDLDRNVTVTGKKQVSPYNANLFHLSGIELGPPGQAPTVAWEDLYMHSWDIDHISGTSLYDGKRYGMSFVRRDARAPLRPDRKFKQTSDFSGLYKGSYDGRPAQLLIGYTVAQGIILMFDVVFWDLARSQVFEGRTARDSTKTDHSFGFIQLNERGGSGILYWNELYLHTWNISYLSGSSQWQVSYFGMSFERQGLG